MFKILIIDDSPLSQMALCNILTPEQEESCDALIIEVAESGPEALKKAAEFYPDLILLDIIMPGMSGFEVLTTLKSSDVTRSIPVIIISSLSDDESEEKGLVLGAVDYIRKPFNKSIVLARIKTHQAILEQMQRIESQSLYDPLTNLLNRRSFDFHIERIWSGLIRQKESISVLMIDLDNFKTINDTYGHDVGDIVLRSTADTISGSLKRASDLLFRWGGEEFTVLLPNTELEGAMLIAERVRENIANAVIPCADDGSAQSLTASIGAASMIPCIGATITDLIRQADKAMYSAKESGKNRVCGWMVNCDGCE